MTIFTDLLRVDRTGSEQAMLQDILVGFRMTLGFPLACIVVHEGSRVRVLAVSDARGNTGLEVGPCDADAEIYFQMLRDNELPYVLQNTLKDPLARFLRWIRVSPIGAIASVPIKNAAGGVIGAVCCFSPVPSSIPARDMKVMTVLARIAANIVNSEKQDAKRLSHLRNRIRNVISDARVDIHLQPILNLQTGDVRGYEALSRFEDQNDTMSPRDWFEDARKVGMQPLLECTAIAEAVELLQFLPDDTYLSVNASPETVQIGAVADILQDAPPERIVLDLTEHEDANSLEGLDLALAELRNMGIQIALDNFGAGNLQFPTVVKLQPNILKLDLSLVKSINRNQNSQDLTRAIVQFAYEIDAVLIAVGIEHESERTTLADLGVKFGQGYLLARPDAPDSFGINQSS